LRGSLAEIFDRSTPTPTPAPAATPKVSAPVQPTKVEEPKVPIKKYKQPSIPSSPLGISVRMNGGGEEKKTEESIDNNRYGNAPIDVAELRKLWLEYSQKQENFLKNTMTSAIPELKNDTVAVIEVANGFQQEKIEKVLPELMPYLREVLKNGNLRLEVSVSEEVKTARAFTQKEKLEEMIRENPALGELMGKLSLELD
jgi:hypothetical protein